MEYETQQLDFIVAKLNSNTKTGLSDSAVLKARALAGRNALRETSRIKTIVIFLRQFTSPLAAILIVACSVSFYLGNPRDAAILFTIVTLNALIGFYQEWKSENILASLRKLVVHKCNVIRSGKIIEIFAEDLVPGDVVKLFEGDGIPADIRLIEAHGFSTNEFILTGESLPANKDSAFAGDQDTIHGSKPNCIYMGTSVARGEATGIVYATGANTEIGKISHHSQKIKPHPAPVQIEIADVAKKLTFVTLIIAALLFTTRLLLNDSVAVALVFSVSVAAAMVPEGLPAQISMALALAVGRLSKRKAIVKKMSAAQTLGSATVIASDKTGTITKNEMTITGCEFNGMAFTVSGLGYIPVGEILNEQGRVLTKETLGDMKVFFLSGFLSSTGKINPPDSLHASWYSIGDPTEAAFATLAMKAGFSLETVAADYPSIKFFSFDSFRKRASIVRSHKNKVISFVKGSLESILDSSKKIISNGEIHELTDSRKAEITSMSAAFAESGLRIIAIAYKDIEKKNNYSIDDAETELTFAGFVSMLDPPHPEVKEAIESVFKAHMKVFMITGDNELTAKAISRSIGLMNENNAFPEVVNGKSLQAMSDEDVQKKFNNRAVIFSRVSPDDKFRIVDLLKKQGEIVAVTGDGVNDTLSLKRADIGIAMGINGSNVAQEAANMILLDDNFSTILVAVKEGRTLFRNLEKTIKANLSANMAELTCVIFGFVGIFWGLPTPILVVQILLIDMVGEMFPLIMLTYDPAEKKIMENAPRNPTDKILTPQTMMGILFSGLVMGITAYAAFLYVYFTQGSEHYEKAITVTFASVILGQFSNLLSRRTYGFVFGKYLFSNVPLLLAFVLSFSCTLLIVYVPLLNTYFHTAPLSMSDWLYPFSASTACLCIYELKKFLWDR